MDDIEFQKFIECSPECEDLALLLTLDNKEFLFKIINEYEIYNEYIRTLFDICNFDTDEILNSLIFISSVSSITKEIVHGNLSLNNPLPFKSNSSSAPYTAIIMEYVDEKNSFVSRYNKQKDIENQTPPQR